jgi:hypothetical protein
VFGLNSVFRVSVIVSSAELVFLSTLLDQIWNITSAVAEIRWPDPSVCAKSWRDTCRVYGFAW